MLAILIEEVQGTAVKLQYCSQVSARDLSLMLTDSGSLLQVDSVFHPTKVSKIMCTFSLAEILLLRVANHITAGPLNWWRVGGPMPLYVPLIPVGLL